MRVLIINSHSDLFNPEKRILLGPLYLGSVLRKHGHEVRFLDTEKDKVNTGKAFNAAGYYEDRLAPLLDEFEPDMIGLSVHYSGAFLSAIDLARFVKGRNKEIITVIGGQHATIFGKIILERYPEMDFVLKGESEETFAELVNSLCSGRDYSMIDGLVYRQGQGVFENQKNNFIEDVDAIPFPDYSLVNMQEYHFDTSRWLNPKRHKIDLSFPILTSRSCPHRCNFCAMFLVQGPKFRMRSAENVVNEIEHVYNKYDQRYFSIIDDNFSLDKKRVLDICSLIKERGLDIQFDTTNGMEINHVTKEIMDALIGAGFIRTFFAMESGSEYIRTKVMRKPLPQNRIYEAFDVLRHYDGRFDFNVLFIIGFPQETRETLEETRNIIRELGLKKVAIGFAIPYPGTRLYDEVSRNNLFTVPEASLLEHPALFNFSKEPLIRPMALRPEELISFRQEVYEEVNLKNAYKTDF